MGCVEHVVGRDGYLKVRGDGVRPTRIRRSDCSPHEPARQLLEYDQPGHTALVDIHSEARQAVLFHERDHYAIAVMFGPNCLADGGPKIAGSDYWLGIEHLVASMAAYWD